MMNNKYLNTILFLSVLWLMACNHSSTNITSNDDYMELCDVYTDVKTYNLEPIDTIYSFASEYPVGIEAAGNKLFLTLAMQDTAICVIDKATGTKLKAMGHKGSGPDDVISPGFFYNRCISADSCLLIEDINARKLIGISINDLSMRKESLPQALYGG